MLHIWMQDKQDKPSQRWVRIFLSFWRTVYKTWTNPTQFLDDEKVSRYDFYYCLKSTRKITIK